MTQLNIFAVVMAISAFMLMAGATVGIVAPSLGIETPNAPTFPNLPDLNVQGNFNETWAFDETNVVILGSDAPTFDDFSPDKRVRVNGNGFMIDRFGTWAIIPWWYGEPIFTTDGVLVSGFHMTSIKFESFLLPAQVIINFYNTSSGASTFIIDLGSKEYEAHVDFTVLAGYSNMVDSWNVGRGFTVRIYGNAYEPPTWDVQAVAYLSWFGAAIAYFVYFAAYMVSMAAVMLTLFGLVPALASGVIVIVIIAFVGSLLMFLRGSSDK